VNTGKELVLFDTGNEKGAHGHRWPPSRGQGCYSLRLIPDATIIE
jgi:hypothetical protein